MKYPHLHTRLFFFIVCTFISIAAMSQQKQSASIQRNFIIYTDVMRQLDMNYFDTLNYEKLTETAINQMLRQIDPYTIYIPKREDENLRMMTMGKYGGIGAVIMQRDSGVYISNPYEGMPAQSNDVLAGDQILQVDGWDCIGKTTKEVSDRLRGKPGTIVHLKLLRPNMITPIERSFERKDIHLPAVTYHTSFKQDTIPPIGYVQFSEFTSGSAKELLVAVEELVNTASIGSLIIDLRGNGGGIIDEAIQLVSYFVDRGVEVVNTKGKIPSSNRSYTTKTSPLYRNMPLIVMVNGQSASAAEIVSGSLQDMQRATIVGQRTFGKGLVQSVRPIAYDGHLKVTTAHYYLPSGRCIQAIDYDKIRKEGKDTKDTIGGITPDVIFTDSQKVDITYSLYVKHMFFDYATQYRTIHDTIPPPQLFTLSNQDIEDFIQFLDDKGYTYETETSKYFNDMINMAKHEDLDSTIIASFESMRPRLNPSYKEAILRNIEEVKEMLGAEIVERYYFQRGRMAYLLRFDKELEQAIQIMQTKK